MATAETDTATIDAIEITCRRCDKLAERKDGDGNTTTSWQPLKGGAPPQPKGWHRLGEGLFCPTCWHEGFAMRAIQLPVASVMEGYDSEWTQANTKAGWQAFRAALRQSAQQAARFSNLALSELYAADKAPLIETTDGKTGKTKTKLPPMPKVSLYGLGREAFAELDSQSLGSLIQKATAKYKEKRWDLRVTRKTSLPVYRELPVPLPAKDARLEISHAHQADVPAEKRKPGTSVVFVRVRVAGKRFTLRLRNGGGDKGGRYSFLRKIAALEKVGDGRALQGEVSLLEKSASGAHGNAGSARADNGAPKFATQVFATVSVYLPKEKGERRDLELTVKTGPERLWTVFVGSREEAAWVLNEDQARRWSIARRAALQRLSDDAKFERRSRLRGVKIEPADLAERCRAISENYQRRLDDWAHKAAAMLAGFAKRQGASTVNYDDADKSFSPSLPWFKLRVLVQQKLDFFGINFKHLAELPQSGDNGDA